MNADYWNVVRDGDNERFACQREVNGVYETSEWFSDAGAASLHCQDLNEYAEEEAALCGAALPDHLK